jgi:hypothetical protein
VFLLFDVLAAIYGDIPKESSHVAGEERASVLMYLPFQNQGNIIYIPGIHEQPRIIVKKYSADYSTICKYSIEGFN